MKALVLDEKTDGESKCFLCRIFLEEYINGLPSTYSTYEIQREIVSNVYLDHLIDTVTARKHIPPIVLVVEGADLKKRGNELEIKTFKILDGLQRTFRLEAIRKTIKYCVEKLDPPAQYLGLTKFKLSRDYSEDLRKFNSNTDILISVLKFFQEKGKGELLKTFTDNSQWFEIWTNLSAEEEVNKMLLLNAGHKPVNTRHQLELLFLNLLPILKQGDGREFNLVREKEIKGMQFSKNRQAGNFHFAHIITALLSFYEKTPVALSAGLIQDIQNRELGLDEYREITKPPFLKKFIAFLVQLDKQITEQYGASGVLWIGREVSLSALFAALGAAAQEKGESRLQIMERFLTLTKEHDEILNLDKFEEVRNNLDLSKVNFGSVNRRAVFNAVKLLLTETRPKKIDWSKYFERDGE